MRTSILAAVVAVMLGSISTFCQGQEPTTTAPAATTKQAVDDLEQMRINKTTDHRERTFTR